MIYCVERVLSSQSFRINIGIHRQSSILWQHDFHGGVGHNGRQAPATTDTPSRYRELVASHPTLLEPRSSLTSGGYRCPSGSPHIVRLMLLVDRFYVKLTPPCSDPPAWKQLISHPASLDERINLLTSIFPHHNEVEMARTLSKRDAQAFVDVLDEVNGNSYL